MEEKNEPSNCKNFLSKKLISFPRDEDKTNLFTLNPRTPDHLTAVYWPACSSFFTFFICFVKPTNVNHLIITFNHFFCLLLRNGKKGLQLKVTILIISAFFHLFAHVFFYFKRYAWDIRTPFFSILMNLCPGKWFTLSNTILVSFPE